MPPNLDGASPEPVWRQRPLLVGLGLTLVLAVLAGGAWWLRPVEEPPPPEPTGEVRNAAHFTAIEGSVKVKHVGSFQWIDASPATALRKNDLVRTSSGSSAEVTFFDDTVLHVRPDSLITIEESFEDPSTQRRKVAWHVSSGEVNFETGQRNVVSSSTEVSTPTIRVRQGAMSAGGIRVGEAGNSDIRQFRGRGEVQTTSGERIALASREALQIDASGNASEKQALPQAPQLVAPPNQAEIGYRNPSRETTLLAWDPVPGASSYRVMLDYTDAFNRPLVDQRGIRQNSVELEGLDPGKYYWQVSAIGGSDMEGAFSDKSGFLLVKASVPDGPTLVVETLDVRNNILQIKGRTEPGARVTVNGLPVDVGDDGRFAEFLTLERPGKQSIVIRATGPDGGIHEETRPVMVVG
jgi:hypothetical protein